ncbi:MAG: ABC transporter ATP-binding protein [Actinomycetota bacterium]
MATVVVFRRAWRRSGRSQQASTVPLRSTRHPLLQIIGSRRRRFYLASLLSILGQISDMVPFLLFGWMAVVLAAGKSAALVRLGLASTSGQLWFLAGATALAYIVAAALSFITRVLWRNLAQSVQHEWRTETYAHVQRVELRYLEGERTTRLARMLTDDIDQLGRFLATSANDLLQLGTAFFVLLPAFLFFAPGIAWIAFLPVPIITWLSFFYQEHAAADYASSSENGSLLNSQLINNLEASATVKSFVAEEYEIDRIHRLSEAYRQSNRQIDTHAAAYIQIVRVCAVTSFAGTVLLGSLGVLTGALSFAAFNLLIGLPQLILWKLPALGDAVDQYQGTVAALGRVLDLYSLPVESGGTGRRLDAAKVKGEMVLEGVTFAYPGRSPVFQNLSLRIAPRKTTGIVGATGAGKTTIVKLLMRFQDVTSGRVLLDGLDIRYLRLQDLRNAIGFVGQDAFLFDGTVGDNIRYGSFDADPERLATAARMAEADGFVEALPSGYDTMIGERGATLSGGQKQRISLARAILKGAPIAILDEATSAVDNETEAAIQRALKDFARDRTLVIIAHRLSTIRHADRIYVLDRSGAVVEEGTHHELLEREGAYASLWRLQIGEARS